MQVWAAAPLPDVSGQTTAKDAAHLMCLDQLDRALQEFITECASSNGAAAGAGGATGGQWKLEDFSDNITVLTKDNLNTDHYFCRYDLSLPADAGFTVDNVASFLQPVTRNWDPYCVEEEVIDAKLAENVALVRSLYEGVGRVIIAEFYTLDGLFLGPTGGDVFFVRTSAPPLALPQLGVPPGKRSGARVVRRELPWSGMWVREGAACVGRFGVSRSVLLSFICKCSHEAWMNFGEWIHHYARGLYRTWIARILKRSVKGLVDRLTEAAAVAAGLAGVGALAGMPGAAPARGEAGEAAGADGGGEQVFDALWSVQEDAVKRLAEKESEIVELRRELESLRLERAGSAFGDESPATSPGGSSACSAGLKRRRMSLGSGGAPPAFASPPSSSESLHGPTPSPPAQGGEPGGDDAARLQPLSYAELLRHSEGLAHDGEARPRPGKQASPLRRGLPAPHAPRGPPPRPQSGLLPPKPAAPGSTPPSSCMPPPAPVPAPPPPPPAAPEGGPPAGPSFDLLNLLATFQPIPYPGGLPPPSADDGFALGGSLWVGPPPPAGPVGILVPAGPPPPQSPHPRGRGRQRLPPGPSVLKPLAPRPALPPAPPLPPQ